MGSESDGNPEVNQAGENSVAPDETPEERATRLCDRLRGLFKEEIAAYGGAEAFIRWVRYDEGTPPEK